MAEQPLIETIEVSVDEVRSTIEGAFGRLVSDEEAMRITDALVEAELAEVPTHGILRVPWYLDGLREGVYAPAGELRLTRTSAVVADVDGGGALGYLPTWRALDPAVEAARTHGVGITTVRRIGEFGRAGYYAAAVAQQGLIGVVVQNTIPLLGPPGATAATHGNNPLAFAVPGDDGPAFDAAFTPRSGGEIRRRALLGLPIPEEWGYRDAEGRPTTDPARVVGAVQPAIGGAKGFGMAVLVDVLAGALAGASSGHLVRPGPSVGAFVLVLDPAAFPGGETVVATMHESASYVRSVGGRWPGDRSRAARARHTTTGSISVPVPIWEAMASAIQRLG